MKSISTMSVSTKLKMLQLFVAALFTLIANVFFPIGDIGFVVFFVPIMFLAAYLWAGILFFFADLIWKLIARPQERLFAITMLGSSVFITAMLGAAYWLIKDSLGIGGTIFYAILAYCVFSIVRWFRRHTASYYAALESEQRNAESTDVAADNKSL
ncbi:hypothetical protein [Ahrensia sp. 13_GOM-1096m]|uniref:hypothetical protein n=1 Tax=Ahrensia sp. 13_GOM-1096m TaxID=1380380 RepID=UPI00047ADC02|nr:hypothetical protein [Ahrensia sp. 13_GOM-1096m]